MLGAILLPGADEAGGGLLLTGGTELGRGAAELLAGATPVLLGRGGLGVCCTGGAPEDGGGAVSMAATLKRVEVVAEFPSSSGTVVGWLSFWFTVFGVTVPPIIGSQEAAIVPDNCSVTVGSVSK